jgi:predicted transcriptional regulator of viral defense system
VSYLRTAFEHARDNHGLITTQQASGLGIPAIELVKLAHRGSLVRIAYGLYRHEDVPATRLTEYAEAVLRVGEDAFLVEDAVLAMHELALVNPRAIKVGTTRRVRRSLPAWVELVRYTDDVDITTYEGIRSTTVACALRACVGTVPRDRLRDALEEARRRGLVRPQDMGTLTDAPIGRQL